MLKEADEQRAIDAVKRRNPQGTDFEVTGAVSDFLDGELAIVGFALDEAG